MRSYSRYWDKSHSRLSHQGGENSSDHKDLPSSSSVVLFENRRKISLWCWWMKPVARFRLHINKTGDKPARSKSTCLLQVTESDSREENKLMRERWLHRLDVAMDDCLRHRSDVTLHEPTPQRQQQGLEPAFEIKELSKALTMREDRTR